MIDLRSDTITQPTPAMRQAMAEADLGDDVFGEDPTINRLQDKVAELFGKEAALYVPSGTMSNQIAIRAQTQPGDELFCEFKSHIYNFEAGGPAVLSGVMCHPIEGDCGIIDVSQLDGKVRPVNEHFVRSRMVALENTANCGGGKVYPLEKIQAISEWAQEHGLIRHLDGARIWNAIVATGIDGRTWASHFDSVSVCFSKGLGAPIGSALLGSQEMITRARHIRKLFGGGLRQGGVAAAAALHAVENHLPKLQTDHQNAQIIAEAIRSVPELTLTPAEVETNLIWFTIDNQWADARDFANALKERQVQVLAMNSTTLRACTHLNISTEQAQQAAQAILEVAEQLRSKTCSTTGKTS